MTQVLIKTKLKHNGYANYKNGYKVINANTNTDTNVHVKAIVLPWPHVCKRMQVFKCSTYRRPLAQISK